MDEDLPFLLGIESPNSGKEYQGNEEDCSRLHIVRLSWDFVRRLQRERRHENKEVASGRSEDVDSGRHGRDTLGGALACLS